MYGFLGPVFTDQQAIWQHGRMILQQTQRQADKMASTLGQANHDFFRSTVDSMKRLLPQMAFTAAVKEIQASGADLAQQYLSAQFSQSSPSKGATSSSSPATSPTHATSLLPGSAPFALSAASEPPSSPLFGSHDSNSLDDVPPLRYGNLQCWFHVLNHCVVMFRRWVSRQTCGDGAFCISSLVGLEWTCSGTCFGPRRARANVITCPSASRATGPCTSGYSTCKDGSYSICE